MCLYIDKEKTEQLRKSALKTPNKKIPLIKNITIVNNTICTSIKYIKLTAGWLEADGKAYIYKDTINAGAIHAYRPNKNILNTIKQSPYRYMKCFAYAKDFIAYGTNDDICFKRIYIPIEEYERIAKKEKIEL